MDEQTLLRQLIQGPASGDALAQRFGVTRAAIWKRINSLRQAGVPIEGAAGQGYRLGLPLDLLDQERIVALLPRSARTGLAELEVVWSLGSTNSELLHRTTPQRGAAVLIAEQQTAGRGRRGRVWRSPLAANLYCSISRRYSGGLARLGGLSLAAGVAVAEALQALGLAQVRLKWPNDLVVVGRKLGGLLVEGSGEPAGAARAVVGIGLNVHMPAQTGESIDQAWTDLAAQLREIPDRNTLAARVLAHVLVALEAFDRDGLPPFLSRIATLDALAGKQVTVLGGEGEATSGRALGVAEDGALRVQVGAAERRFHAGEVSVRNA